ncbi:hypothetical protein Hanom_Chr03g00228331 [Helianthus anomalus]
MLHGGMFIDPPSRRYMHAQESFIDSADIDDLRMEVLEEMVKAVSYDGDMVFYFHYKVPNLRLDIGLRPLTMDINFYNLFEHVLDGIKLIEIYVESWSSLVFLNSINSNTARVGPLVQTESSTLL